MPGKFLIDVTDPRFFVGANADVIDFVRRTNPFAHSDVGSLLISLGKALPGARWYCLSYPNCAYVVLHTDAFRIFAIAFDMRGLAFRLAPASFAEAIADGASAAKNIGPDWVTVAPWEGADQRTRLERWCSRALADAASDASA